MGRDVIIGTAGHIDHGKTTLVKALTGIDADRLQEEKRRGITIDIGFANLDLEGRRIGFIDVPGHEKFVKNMLAGIGGIDIAMLVVAADESVMPQTLEHFQICRLLDIRQGIVVLTKKNKVDPELVELVGEEVKDLVAGSFLEGAPVVAVDSPSLEGIDVLKKALAESIDRIEGNSAGLSGARSHFRMPVDRVFTIRGFGTVVTGTPVAGELALDAPLCAYPSERKAKVRGIEIFNSQSEKASAGQRTALNLTGIEKQDLNRGILLAPPGAFSPSFMVDVELHLLENAPASLEHLDPIRLHHGSSEILGRAFLLDRSELRPGGAALAQLRLDTPTVACLGDRFILRRYSPMTTIGGGRVLDGCPPKHYRRDLDSRLPRLRGLVEAMNRGRLEGLKEALRYALEDGAEQGVPLNELSAKTGLVLPALKELLDSIDDVRIIRQEPLLAVLDSGLERLRARIIAFLEEFHSSNPLAAGASREEVKKRFLPRAAGGYFQEVLDSMVSDDLLRLESGTVGLCDRKVRLDVEQQEIRDRILTAVEQAEWNPPTLDQLKKDLPFGADKIQDVFFYMLYRKELVRITENLVLNRESIDNLIEILRRNFTAGDGFSVGDFKDLLGISRKFAIPYLEYLDRAQITQRVGDQRVLK